ncbi:hypothetical protein F5B21DRAFT_483083 [Xylaria acuta]|nr:hypothetical protein F5B21DRAFT_483083 [Xylaria acuta]
MWQLKQTPPISPKTSSIDEIPGERHRFSDDLIHSEAEELVSKRLSASSIPIASVNQEANHPSRDSIHSEVEEPVSKRLSASLICVASASQETSYPSLSIAQRLLALGISFINLATQRSSRANAARVEDTIGLIKSVPNIRRTRVTNLRRKLTAHQYGELLRAIQNSEDAELQAFFEDELRFDYTRSKKQFEVRIPTVVHEVVGNKIGTGVENWTAQLQKSVDAKISNAASSVMGTGSADVGFPFAKGESDSKSPDKSFMHKKCKSRCIYPNVVVEVGFSQSSKDLQEKAEAYIRRSKGEIRAVVGVGMDKMFRAEKRNEDRLKKMYMATRELHETESYSYEEDEKNETGEASILIWRPEVRGRDGVVATCVQNEKFRDEKGNPIGSAPLRLPLQDFICKATEYSSTGTIVAPQLEIFAGDLCMWIDEALVKYRTKRNMVVKNKVEEEKRKQKRDDARKNSKRGQGIGTRGGSCQALGSL